MSKWFRFYECALDDPKVQKLAPPLFKAWVNLLCLASRNEGALPSVDDIAFAIRVDEDRALEWVSALVSAGLIDDFETGMAPHNWDARQFKSDVSTDRVKRFRKQAKTVSETVVEAPPEQNRAESDTEAEKKVSSETASPPRTQKAPPEDFLEFWKAYPTDPIMSRKEGLAQWNKLTPDERAAALAAVPAFVAHCRANPDYRPVHACRFLAQRRFDGFSAAAQPLALVSSGFYAAAGSKQLEAWQDHKFKTTGKSCPVDAKGGWTFPSEYPPSTREDAA